MEQRWLLLGLTAIFVLSREEERQFKVPMVDAMENIAGLTAKEVRGARYARVPTIAPSPQFVRPNLQNELTRLHPLSDRKIRLHHLANDPGRSERAFKRTYDSRNLLRPDDQASLDGSHRHRYDRERIAGKRWTLPAATGG